MKNPAQRGPHLILDLWPLGLWENPVLLPKPLLEVLSRPPQELHAAPSEQTESVWLSQNHMLECGRAMRAGGTLCVPPGAQAPSPTPCGDRRFTVFGGPSPTLALCREPGQKLLLLPLNPSLGGDRADPTPVLRLATTQLARAAFKLSRNGASLVSSAPSPLGTPPLDTPPCVPPVLWASLGTCRPPHGLSPP